MTRNQELLWLLDTAVGMQQKLARYQKPDPNHTRLTKEVIDKWAPRIPCGKVLDVGCGQGIAKEHWERHGFEWIGCNIGACFTQAERSGLKLVHQDMHLFHWDSPVEVIYARHVLEHSPIPFMSLLRWRLLADWCIVIVPVPSVDAFNEKSHLSLFPRTTWERYFKLVGWTIEEFDKVPYNNPPPWPQDGDEWRWLLK